MKAMREHNGLCRLTAMLLCLCVLVSGIGGLGTTAALAEGIQKPEPTEHIVTNSRVADPDTMDDYLNRLLTEKDGSRYAGRVWTDKTVFAYGGGNKASQQVLDAGGESHLTGTNEITLKMATDGYDSTVTFNSDFAHVFSTLASSQVIDEYPPSPIDMVLVLDISSSMSDDTEPDPQTPFGKAYTQLTEFFTTGVGAEWLNDSDFQDYYTENKKGDETPVHLAVRRTLDHTRYVNLIYSADNVIKNLMANNKENRVAVIVYDRRASVMLPLAHYEPNTVPISQMPGYSSDYWDYHYLPGSPKEDPYQDADDQKNIGTRKTTDIIGDCLKDMVFGYLCPYIDGHGANPADGRPGNYITVSSRVRVVAEATESDVTTRNIEDSSASNPITRLSGTNTHAGLTAGLEQLANANETTLTATLSNGEIATVPRIPVAVVMTDGGSNTVANGPWYDPDYATPVQRSDHKNEWSTAVVTQYLLTAAYLKSAVEKNYSEYMNLNGGEGQDLPVYTVGVDLRDDSDDWVPARLYPMMDPANYFMGENVPDYAGNPSATEGRIPLAKDNDRPWLNLDKENKENQEYDYSRSNEGIIAKPTRIGWLGKRRRRTTPSKCSSPSCIGALVTGPRADSSRRKEAITITTSFPLSRTQSTSAEIRMG